MIVEAANESEFVSSDPAPAAFLTDLGASSINYSLHVWHDPQRAVQWRVVDDVVERVKAALDEAGVAIPFDQLTLHFAEPEVARSAAPDDRA